MNTFQKQGKIAPLVAGFSLILGLLFNYLFFDREVGLSFPAFILIFSGVAMFLHVRAGRKLPADSWLLLPMLVFAFIPGILDSPFLVVLNIFAVLGLSILLMKNATGLRIGDMDVLGHLFNLILTPFEFLRSWIGLSRALNESKPRFARENVWFRVFTGLIVALPVLFILAALLSEADMAFGSYLDSIFTFSIPENWIGRTIVVFIGTVFSAGVLWRLLAPESRTTSEHAADRPGPSRGIEVATFLGSVAALFLLFILVQIRYLFGGEANIARLGFTYAEYARSGFWELIAVAAITLALLVLSQRASRSNPGKTFIIPASLIVGEVFVIIFSAYKRLQLYVEAYGETILRFYVAAAIIFLFVLFVIAGYRIIRAKRESFLAHGALLALIALVAVLDLMGPEAFIVRKNFELHARTGKIDIEYMRNLSADAVPELLKNMDRLGQAERDQLNRVLADKRSRLDRIDGSWRSWNLSRTIASGMLD